MSRTHFEHATYALLMQAPFLIYAAFVSTAWLSALIVAAGALPGTFFFLGREHSQIQAALGVGDFEALRPSLWSTDARLDFLFPVIATWSLALGYGIRILWIGG